MFNKNELIKAAEEAGACKQKGISLISKANNINDLILLLKSPQGIEFCMSKKFPSVDFLKVFKKGLSKSSVFVDGTNNIKNPTFVVAFGGISNIDLDGFNVCQVYATNDANINIKARNNSIAYVELHNNAKMKVSEQDVGSKIKVYKK